MFFLEKEKVDGEKEQEPILSLQSNHFNPLGYFHLESFHVYPISYTCHISLPLSLSLFYFL